MDALLLKFYRTKALHGALGYWVLALALFAITFPILSLLGCNGLEASILAGFLGLVGGIFIMLPFAFSMPSYEQLKIYNDPANRNVSFEDLNGGRHSNCKLHFKTHTWTPGIEQGNHIWFVCNDCGKKKIQYHVSCHPSCAFGPA